MGFDLSIEIQILNIEQINKILFKILKWKHNLAKNYTSGKSANKCVPT